MPPPCCTTVHTNENGSAHLQLLNGFELRALPYHGSFQSRIETDKPPCTREDLPTWNEYGHLGMMEGTSFENGCNRQTQMRSGDAVHALENCTDSDDGTNQQTNTSDICERVTSWLQTIQQRSKAFVRSWQGVSPEAIRDPMLSWRTTHKIFSTLKSTTENNCTRNHLTGGHRNLCWTDDVWYSRCTKPCWACEHLRDDGRNHLSSKLKEHGFGQGARDPCLFCSTDVCAVSVHTVFKTTNALKV